MSPATVLIVEDEDRVATALGRVLSLPQGGGHTVITCASGEEALRKLRETGVDLIITDLRMPGMNGLDLLEAAHQISPNTRSVLITAFGTLEVEQRAHYLANAYLPKPFQLKDFLRTVETALAASPVTVNSVIAFSEDGLRAIQQRLDTLRTDTGALSVLLPDWSGQLLVECGHRSETQSDVLFALLGNSMAAATEVARLLKEEDGFDLQYHEGKHYEVYAAMVSDTIFMALLFDRRMGGSRIGLVSLYMRRAIEDLRSLLSTAQVDPRSAFGLRDEMMDAVDSALDDAFQDFADKSQPDRPAPPVQPEERPTGPLLSFAEAQRMGLLHVDQNRT